MGKKFGRRSVSGNIACILMPQAIGRASGELHEFLRGLAVSFVVGNQGLLPFYLWSRDMDIGHSLAGGWLVVSLNGRDDIYKLDKFLADFMARYGLEYAYVIFDGVSYVLAPRDKPAKDNILSIASP